METLSEEIWDIVIAGTSLPQSLLALSLSKSGEKVLHVDRNSFYGGHDAGFSLQDAETWAHEVNNGGSSVFSNATISQHDPSLAPSRSYTLSLNPQIIYAQSSFLPTLVSSQIHTQLEFLAVGSWWLLRDQSLQKIPGTREAIHADDSLPRRDKTNLMKLLRFALQPDQDDQQPSEPPQPHNLKEALEQRFHIPNNLQLPILALTLSSNPAAETDFDTALQRIRRHVRSVGYFGPGFGAVIAKYGGNAEIAQVACRAQAVGGGIYLLGHGIDDIRRDQNSTKESLLHVTLSDGTRVRCRYVVGMADDLPNTSSENKDATDKDVETIHSISIVNNALKTLFPATSDDGPVPAAAIVLVEDTSNIESPPIYLQVHSEDTGECPASQCIIYASVKASNGASAEVLQKAVESFLSSFSLDVSPRIMWSTSYTSRRPASFQALKRSTETAMNGNIVVIPESPCSIALEDDLLNNVQAIWQDVMRNDAEDQSFLQFEGRERDTDTLE